jgi:hypothetical protein
MVQKRLDLETYADTPSSGRAGSIRLSADSSGKLVLLLGEAVK